MPSLKEYIEALGVLSVKSFPSPHQRIFRQITQSERTGSSVAPAAGWVMCTSDTTFLRINNATNGGRMALRSTRDSTGYPSAGTIPVNKGDTVEWLIYTLPEGGAELYFYYAQAFKP